jgi:AcrR family transcriptional regulator
METRGVGALNTNAVAERAGVSIGSLYQYFPGKDAIIVALLERENEIFTLELARAADAAGGRWIGEDIDGLLRFGLSHHLQKPHLARLLEVEFKRLQSEIDMVSAHAHSRAAMVRLLERHRSAIDANDLELAAQEVGVIAKALMENAGQRADGDWDAAIKRTVRAILGYLGVDQRVSMAAE